MENNKREWPPVRRPRRRGVNIRPIALALALVLLVGAAVGGTQSTQLEGVVIRQS